MMTALRPQWIALLLLSPSPQAFGQATYTDLLPLFRETINADGGVVRGFIDGPIADEFQKAFKAYALVEVEAKAIASFQSTDCKRIELKFIRRGVVTPQGPTDAILTSQLNICADGSPPTDGMDFSRVAPYLTPNNPIPSDLPIAR